MKTTEKPTSQEFHIDGVKHINPQDALDSLKNNEAVLIDVRESNEVDIECIPLDNVIYHPMSTIMDHLSSISKDQNIILMCPGGVRSTKVANLLNIQGYPNVANLDGGFKLWKSMGLPFVIISHQMYRVYHSQMYRVYHSQMYQSYHPQMCHI